MAADSVAAKIFKIGSVFLRYGHLTILLWSAFVSITKMNMMKLHNLKVRNAETALLYYSIAWTFVVTSQVKCLTFRSRSKVKLTFGVIK